MASLRGYGDALPQVISPDDIGKAYEVIGVAVAPAADEEVSPRGDEVLLVRTTSPEGNLLLAGSAISIDAATDEPEVALSAWREQRLRSWKRGSLADKLLDFIEDLTLAHTREAICDVVKRHARRSVGGSHAEIVLVGTPWDLATRRDDAQPLITAGLTHSADVDELGSPWAEALREEVNSCGASLVAHVPFGRLGGLFLFERRGERIFDAYDWRLLTTLGEQGSRAVERVEMLRAAEKLSLTDPLTGLANRRQMEIVMRHAWAAAERGGELAVLLLDLDGFKDLNDRHGHSLGDQILRLVADTLCREIRGADLAVRYGGDEFLVILPGGTAEGAGILGKRIEQRLTGWVQISTGAAVYDRSLTGANQLIEEADRNLYCEKARRKSSPAEALPGAGFQPLPLPQHLPSAEN